MATPIRSPRKNRMGGMNITAIQKQILIDTLQAEITERARRLRAQYASQAEGVRARVLLRVNRLPKALRGVTMGELMHKYDAPAISETMAVKSSQASAKADDPRYLRGNTAVSASPMRGQKRKSDELSSNNDFTNDQLRPSKRVACAPVPADTASTQDIIPASIPPQMPTNAHPASTTRPVPLGVRSPNSQTLTRSPIKPIYQTLTSPSKSSFSPAKAFLARPISPLKPQAPLLAGGAMAHIHSMVEKARTKTQAARAGASARKATAASMASTNAAAPLSKRQASTATIRAQKNDETAAPVVRRPARGRGSDSSVDSEASSGTVVNVKARKAAVPPTKRTVLGTIKGLGSVRKTNAARATSKTAAAAVKVADTAGASVAAGRTLRSRAKRVPLL